MQNYNIRYLPIAEDDLNEIVDYLLEYSADAANINTNINNTIPNQDGCQNADSI